jgi:tetratricopeptide (TPR) repeat protein
MSKRKRTRLFRGEVTLDVKNLCLGTLHFSSQEEMESFLQNALHQDITNGACHLILAEFYLHTLKLDKCQFHLDNAKVFIPDHSHVWFVQTMKWCMEQKFSKAIQSSLKLIQSSPQYASAWRLAGDIYIHLNQVPKAIGYLLKAIQLDPNELEAFELLQTIYLKQHDYNKAFEIAEMMIRRFPSQSCFHVTAGVIDMARKNYSAAERFLKKATQLDPSNITVYKMCMVLYAKMKNTKLFKQYRDRAMNLNPTDPELDLPISHYHSINLDESIEVTSV